MIVLTSEEINNSSAVASIHTTVAIEDKTSFITFHSLKFVVDNQKIMHHIATDMSIHTIKDFDSLATGIADISHILGTTAKGTNTTAKSIIINRSPSIVTGTSSKLVIITFIITCALA